MKIIGKTEDGFILDASRKEVANLIGFFSGFGIKNVTVGSEIEVHHMYSQLYELSHFKAELGNISDKLEKYAKELRPLMPLQIMCPTKGEGEGK